MQRYAQTQELVDLLALQKMKNDRAAATSAVQGAMQPPPGTVKGQLEQEAMQGARNDVMRSMAPGIQQRGRQMAQMQNRAAMGIPTQAAPNMPRMAMGGIVGYQAGGDVMVGPPEPNMLQRMGQGLKNMGGNMAESSDILRAAKAGIGVPYENRAAAIQQVRDEIAAQKQNRDPNFIQRMGQKLMDMGLNVQESNRILKEAYSNIGKTYEEKAKGMAMGGIVGYQEGGGVKSYQTGDLVEEEDEPIIPLGALFELMGRGRDFLFSPSRATQEAREIRRGEVEEASERGVNLLNVLPPSQGITPEQLASFDKVDVTGSLPPRIVEQRRERVESGEAAKALEEQALRRAEANAARREGKTPSAENAGITAGMYDVRNMRPEEKLTMAQQLMKLPKVPRERTEEKPKRDIDLRPLREFLLGGAGQTSTAGALAGGARGLGAFQTAEQARADKIQQAANELQLKRDLAANEAAMLDRKLLADYQGKLTTAEIGVVQDILEQLNDPFSATGSEYDSKAKAIRDQYERDPVVMEEALLSLKKQFLQQGLNAVRQSVLGGVPPTGTQIAGPASRISE
jgi:hypothetical protein